MAQWTHDAMIMSLLHRTTSFRRNNDIFIVSHVRWWGVCHGYLGKNWTCCNGITLRDQSRYAPSQWETLLQCNNVFHWLGAYLDWSLPHCISRIHCISSTCFHCSHTVLPCVMGEPGHQAQWAAAAGSYPEIWPETGWPRQLPPLLWHHQPAIQPQQYHSWPRGTASQAPWIVSFPFNSLATGRFQRNFRKVIFQLALVIGGLSISCKIVLKWMPVDLIDGKSTLVQVMAWCRQASHYLSQCWPRSLSPYGVIRPQWVNTSMALCTTAVFPVP